MGDEVGTGVGDGDGPQATRVKTITKIDNFVDAMTLDAARCLIIVCLRVMAQLSLSRAGGPAQAVRLSGYEVRKDALPVKLLYYTSVK